MLESYHAETGDYLPVDEGYRDLEAQQRAFDQYGSPRAATPGTSNHGEGIAVDFVNPPVVRGAVPHSWLTAHASQFGFEPLTDPDEPWHWDYTA
jgi:LAS superfamily LD-carboxypeptidase LdcB